jgi:hypothetical protein
VRAMSLVQRLAAEPRVGSMPEMAAVAAAAIVEHGATARERGPEQAQAAG